jgi:hypothetical protein
VGLVWAVEHSVETSASAQAVWQLWADVQRWAEWNAGVERIELRGPFAVGSTILMTPPGDETVELHIAEAIEPDCSSTRPTAATSSCERQIGSRPSAKNARA